MDNRLIDKLSKFTKYLTLGVDSFKEKVSYADVEIKEPHVELVSVFDLHSKKYHWTGKSYPTSGQEDGLIKVRDLKSHFLSLPPGKIMVLGCNAVDLTPFVGPFAVAAFGFTREFSTWSGVIFSPGDFRQTTLEQFLALFQGFGQ